MLSEKLRQMRGIYDEYPKQFWILVLGTFIDAVGGGIMFPFFTLYATRKFDVGMTEVGMIFLLFSVTSLAGNMFGGAMADRLGRKVMMIFGLIASSLSVLAMGVINSFELFAASALIMGLFANTGRPAQQAMVADLLPGEQRSQGYGILRVAMNLGVTIGPAIGGLLAARSYLLLFVSDAVLSIVTAGIVYVAIRETKPESTVDHPETSILETFRGYGTVMRDGMYMFFLLSLALVMIGAVQMNSTLPVYLRDLHGVTERGFGAIMSLNAGMVVLFQFPMMRRIKKYRPITMLAAGSLVYGLGFLLYGFVSIYPLFLVAVAVVTVGEMIVSPVAQALAAQMAPEEMRGRYMAIFGFSYAIPAAIGPLLAGLVIDHANPHLVWYGVGLLGAVAAIAFMSLGRETARREAKQESRSAEAPA